MGDEPVIDIVTTFSSAHVCLGAPLARLEANNGLGLFMDHYERIEPVSGFKLEDHLTPSAAGQTLTSLPVRVHRR